jgi:hypothetical protein
MTIPVDLGEEISVEPEAEERVFRFLVQGGSET